MPTEPLPTVLDVRVVTGSGGGPDKTILNSPRFLEPLGYRNVCAYLHPPGDPGFESLRHRAIELNAPLIDIADRGPWDMRVLRELAGVCRRERVRIYHGHDYKSNALGLLLRRLWPMKMITTVHGWVRHTARTPLYYLIDKFCLPRYQKVICVSPDLVDECRREGVPAKRCILLENGIDLSAYSPSGDPGHAKVRLGFDPARPVIGAVGRLSPEKGFDLLIDAVDRLRHAGTSVQLVIVGDGDQRAGLQAMLAERKLESSVRLAGFQADPRPYYAAMDVFVLSSLREGLPNVLLEAMAMRVPCLATRIAGVPRVIDHGVSGWLMEPGDPDAIASALKTILGDEALRGRLGNAGRQTVEERFSFAERMRKLAAIYDEMLTPARTQCSAW